MSCLETTWQKFPSHFSLRIARESDSFPSNGEPKVMQRTDAEEENDLWRWERSHRVKRDAVVPLIACPVITKDLHLCVISNICKHTYKHTCPFLISLF